MLKKSLLTIGVGLTVVSLGLGQAQPAHAFWLELPTSLKAILEQVHAEGPGTMGPGGGNGGMMQPPPGGGGQQPGMNGGGQQSNMTNPPPCGGMNGGQMGMPQNNFQPNGQGPQGGQPGFNNGGMGGKPIMGNGPMDGNKMGDGMNGGMQQMGDGQGKPLPGKTGGMMSDPTKLLQELKRGGGQMDGTMNRFQQMIGDGQQKGLKLPADVGDRMNKAQDMIKTIKGAQSLDDVKNINPDELDSTMNSLDSDRQNLQQQDQNSKQDKQQLDQMKKQAASQLKGLKNFDQQIAKLTKLKIAIPTTISDQLTKVKTAFATVASATTADDAQTAMEEASSAMQDLQDTQQTLAALGRLPQMKKQSDQLLNNLNKDLKKAKTAADKLSKKGTDLSSVITQFQAAIDKLKAARDAALEKIQNGEVEDGLDDLQTEFFEQMDDVRQYPETIQVMSSLGQFTSNFKQQLTAATRQIKSLKSQGEDTTDLESLFNEAQGKGQAVLDAMKAQPLDMDSVLEALQDFQSARSAFQDGVQQLKPTTSDTTVTQ